MISDVKVWPLKKEHKSIAANASFVVDGFVVKCRVMKSSKGLFVGLPSRQYEDKDGNKKWNDEVFPVNEETRKNLNDAVLNAYNKAAGNTQMNQGEAPGPTDQTKDNIPFG